jgi:hypothetical protein
VGRYLVPEDTLGSFKHPTPAQTRDDRWAISIWAEDRINATKMELLINPANGQLIGTRTATWTAKLSSAHGDVFDRVDGGGQVVHL